MSSARVENINNSFFDGRYKDIWRAIIPEALTKAEVDYLLSVAELKTGSKVLDLMCGYGRHTLALARLGIQVTAVDNLADYVNEVKVIAEKERLPIDAFQQDILQFETEEKYDLVICMGNSISFFNKEDLEKIFFRIASNLKKNGKFIFNSWMIGEIAIQQFKEKSWSYIGDIKYLADSKYLFFPSRIEAESIFIASDGSTEKKMGIDYIYSLDETGAMLDNAGLMIEEIWSIPGKKKFTLGDPRIYVSCRKQ